MPKDPKLSLMVDINWVELRLDCPDHSTVLPPVTFGSPERIAEIVLFMIPTTLVTSSGASARTSKTKLELPDSDFSFSVTLIDTDLSCAVEKM